MDNHVLDRPVWNSLTSTHARFALGARQARRFQTDISPLAGVRDESAESLANLAELVATSGPIVVAQAAPVICPPGAVATHSSLGVQMLFDDFRMQTETTHPITRLDEKDGPAMLALATLTKPGPFADRTYLLGEFWGVKQDGRLIAMAGERLKQPGFTEVSGVCTHPDFQGLGLGQQLCVTVVNRIIERGEQPYLHVYATNAVAIKLYEKLGFRQRQIMNVAQIEAA